MFELRRLSTLLLLLSALALVGALFGCGGDEATEGDAAADAGAQGEPIKIGGPIPLTGPYAADGQSMKQALELAAEDINAAGGVLGRQVEVVTFDIEDMNSEKMTAAADKLALQDKVSAMITGYTNPGSGVDIFGKYPQPYLHFDGSQLGVDIVKEGSAQDPPTHNHVFMLGDVEQPYGEMSFDIMESLPYEYPNKKIAILAGDFEWDIRVTEGYAKRAQEKGWEVAFQEKFPYGTREWGPQLAKIREVNPAIIVISDLDAADQKTFLDQFMQNPTQSLINGDYGVSIPQYPTIVGESANGVIGDATNSVLPDEAGLAFKDRWAEKFGAPPGLSIVGTVYDGVMIWAEAVKKAGDPDNYDEVAKAIKELNYRGLNGTYAFEEGNKVAVSDEMPMHTFQVQDGKLELLYLGTAKQQAEFQTPPWIEN